MKYSDDAVFNKYLFGKKLYGDDFSDQQIKKWFSEEEDGYADLGAKNKNKYRYAYHALNHYHGFRFLPKKKYHHVLGVGSAYGDELNPIIDHAESITILESSDSFIHKDIKGVPIKYEKPIYNGSFNFKNEEFDLVTCFGVLHHIPNVSKVLSEIYRCLNKGGYLLLREPIISMGDWRKHRKGLTKNERGIPLKIFRETLKNTGFKIIKERKCVFPLVTRLSKLLFKKLPYNSKIVTAIDHLFSNIFFFNYTYHARNWIKKIRPISIFYVLYKN